MIFWTGVITCRVKSEDRRDKVLGSGDESSSNSKGSDLVSGTEVVVDGSVKLLLSLELKYFKSTTV